jgi:pimeloyl-ACP methyl ester carboxylesterase
VNELAALGAEYFEQCTVSVPALLQAAQQSASYEGPLSTDTEVLEKITPPFLLLRGQETELDTFYTDTEHYVAEHVVDPLVGLPLPGLGHLGPLLAPEPIARKLVSFFESVLQAS